MSLNTGEMNERMAFRTRNSALSHEIKTTSAPGSESKGSLTLNVDCLVPDAVVSLFSVIFRWSRMTA